MKRSLLLYVKGMAMGAVDVVPGFSGGTVALILGVYDRLLASLAALPQALLLFARGRIRESWQVCNATFLLLLALGILTSVFTLAKAITYLMDTQPVLLWSFFFGLVLVSVWLAAREVSRWGISRLVGFALGVALAVWITLAAPLQLQPDPLTLFLAGAIAISAMILPGVSGSFMLVMMGLYPVVLGAVKNLDFAILILFCAGCLVGMMSFAKILSWLLSRLRDLTLAFLAGIILGSLGKVWPWKHTLTWQTNSRGESYPLLQENVLPERFAAISGQDPQVVIACTLAVLAVVLVYGIDWYGRRAARMSDPVA